MIKKFDKFCDMVRESRTGKKIVHFGEFLGESMQYKGLPVMSYSRATQFRNADIIEIGTTPNEEDCAQANPDNSNLEEMNRQCAAYAAQLVRKHGKPPAEAFFFICTNPHDFGEYRELCLMYNPENAQEQKYADKVASGDDMWDDDAIRDFENRPVKESDCSTCEPGDSELEDLLRPIRDRYKPGSWARSQYDSSLWRCETAKKHVNFRRSGVSVKPGDVIAIQKEKDDSGNAIVIVKGAQIPISVESLRLFGLNEAADKYMGYVEVPRGKGLLIPDAVKSLSGAEREGYAKRVNTREEFDQVLDAQRFFNLSHAHCFYTQDSHDNFRRNGSKYDDKDAEQSTMVHDSGNLVAVWDNKNGVGYVILKKKKITESVSVDAVRDVLAKYTRPSKAQMLNVYCKLSDEACVKTVKSGDLAVAKKLMDCCDERTLNGLLRSSKNISFPGAADNYGKRQSQKIKNIGNERQD